jgi:hypothetical protein
MRQRPRQNQIQRRHGLIHIRHMLGEVTSDIAEAIPVARATKVSCCQSITLGWKSPAPKMKRLTG